MPVGRFGIWLTQVGRVLQTRYANWNSEFRLKRVVYENTGYFNVSSEVTTDYCLSFYGRNAQERKQTSMVRELFDVQGVKSVELQRYRVKIDKATVFSWEELSPAIEQVILRHQTA
ncbi:MAG: hypothetical protein A3D65_00920 [Candidatus Lloydbacteria bacterium RIFCSPHIGHO2_02_FULL_50_13]|uniref:Scaffold protein Nfu/NifU N-terminal domain-containing protein n=1 Tax=Candidatus Lloydbacteria bacterium RIFCSPHIGHO2_02_FULL_50_13 TaxID=1798661 RepID=A0A1G2CZI3_9BACT|nr:MAG: hypothetical protein A3D65_00920 [Candidatus Lloydbacteria bacterium RIFCSPHIGHO2_02_FULL_50_13]